MTDPTPPPPDDHARSATTGGSTEGEHRPVPTGAEPTSADPTHADPIGVDPTGVGSTDADPTGVGSTDADPTGVGSTDADPTGVGSTDAYPTGVGSTDADPTGVGSTDADPTGASPTVTTATPTRRQRVARWWSDDAAPPTPRTRARQRAIRRAVIGSGLLVLTGSFVRLPLLVVSPGPVFNTIGEIQGKPMVTISGTDTYPTSGALDMTTVSERGGSSGGVALGEAIAGWFAPHSSLIPREVFYDPNESGAEVAERNDQAFATSQSDAVAAALRQLDIATEDSVVVTFVGGGTPADGIVEAGDVIVSVNGTKVETPDQVVAAVRSSAVGQTITLEVLRADDSGERTPKTLKVTTAANPSTEASAAGKPWIGIAVGTLYEAPFDVDFAVAGVGGPSAGMMFSLAIYDKLTPGPLTGGGTVAGTGTIDPAGAVGPIGGIDKKLLGARSGGASLFLAPSLNCGEVVGNVPDGLTVVPVTQLSEAIDTVTRWADDHDATFPTCEQVVDEQAAQAS